MLNSQEDYIYIYIYNHIYYKIYTICRCACVCVCGVLCLCVVWVKLAAKMVAVASSSLQWVTGYLLSTIFVHTVPVFVGGFRGPLHPSLIKDPVCTSNQLNFDPLESYFALGPRLASYLHADAFTCRSPEFSPSPQRMCSIDHARSGMMFKVLPLP